MRPYVFISLLLVPLLASAEQAFACSAVRANARLNVFSCPCPTGDQSALSTPIFVVSGTILLSNRRATPTLGSIVVEILAPEKGRYFPVARQVLSASGSSVVETCKGGFSAGPAEGRIALVDLNGAELAFDDVKNLPLGKTAVNYVATFTGPLPLVKFGKRVRIRTYTTAIGVHGTRLCTADANGDGANDVAVKTLVFTKNLKVPTVASLITP